MDVPVQINFHGVDRSDAVEAAVHDKVRHLAHLSGAIQSCRVAIELRQKHQHQGRQFGVRIDLTIPGRELVVTRVAHEDVYVALRDAFDDMKRQLEDAVRVQRGETKLHAPELHGEVVRLDDDGGFGFIRSAEGEEYYFGRDNLVGARFDQIGVGTDVRFIEELAAQGRQAKRVSVGKRHGA